MTLDAAGGGSAVLDAGVRIFSPNEEAGRDPQKGTSKAVDRRTARAMRRNRDRKLRRKSDLMATLVAQGLMPSDPEARKALERLDPYELRARALDEPLAPYELGRALFHLGQRRGFKSNRKTDGADEDDSGKIKTAIEAIRAAMDVAGDRTVGEYLARLHRERRPVRARLRGQGAKAQYDLYVSREMVAEEFDRIWAAQAAFNPALTEAARDAIGGTPALRVGEAKDVVLFRQRDLRPVDPGKCSLIPEDLRAPRALPLAQRFRILKELANLRLIEPGGRGRSLTLAERDSLYGLLLCNRHRTFGQIRRALGLESTVRFNLQDDKRDKLLGDETAARLAGKKAFGPAWYDLSLERQQETVERLLDEQDESKLKGWLASEHGLEPERAAEAARAALPDGHLRFGRQALRELVAVMEREARIDRVTGEVLDAPLDEHDAIARLFPERGDQYRRERLSKLPYYGAVLPDRVMNDSGDPRHRRERQFGRVSNPTVHIGLNQLRKLVNALVDAYGPPERIAIEFARKLKQSAEDKQRDRQRQKANQDANDRRRAQLRSEAGQPVTADNLLRLRLWEELDARDAAGRVCIFTGKPISIHQLFSAEVEIEHLLPFSRTLDNSAANKTVCFRVANQQKANRPPFEAFCHTDEWPGIHARAQSLPPNKRWRFDEGAMERFDSEERDFIDRQLTDTAYLARISKAYLSHICDPRNVIVTPGRLTALLRGKWGLNRILEGDNVRALDFDSLADEEHDKVAKNRDDHRHHAIDAAVIAATDRSTLKRAADASKQSGENLKGLTVDPPWEGFRDAVRDAVRRIVVSHRPDHSVEGRLHEDTAYGLVADPEAEEGYNLVYRKALIDLNENEIARIRDLSLRAALTDFVAARKAAGDKLRDALATYSESQGVRRVRLLKRERGVIAIKDGDGKPYKAYSPGDNHRIEIYRRPGSDTWEGEAVTVFEANQDGHVPQWRQRWPEAEEIMAVHNGDLLEVEMDGTSTILRVVRLNARAKRLYLVEAHEAGDYQKRHEAPDHLDPFRWKLYSYSKLQALNARPLRVDVLGRVFPQEPRP